MSKDEIKKKNDVKNNGKFWKESKAELKKVSWPKPKSLANDTFTVIVIVLVVAAIVALLDVAFIWASENFVIKAEQKLVNSTSITTNENVIDVNDIIESTDENGAAESSTEDGSAEDSADTEVTKNSDAE